jgi:hypothetical protein
MLRLDGWRHPHRHLYIPLVSAERAWAHAMELENEGGSRKRMHRIKRLRKASLWASQLARCAMAVALRSRSTLERRLLLLSLASDA